MKFNPLNIRNLFLVVFILTLLSACQPTSAIPTNPVDLEPTEALSPSEPTSTPTSTSAPDNMLYKDSTAPIEARVEDLLARMTLEEKIGQMTQIEKGSLGPGAVAKYYLGSVLSGGGGSPVPNTAENWAKMVDKFQEEALSTRLGIPIIYGVDAVHGHGNLKGATIFPHNIGLGAANDPDLVYRIGKATAEEMAATGIFWNFAPVLAVVQDIRWGRTYEGYSEDTQIVTSLGAAYIRGLQEPFPSDSTSAGRWVLATTKHYIGDGATVWGSSTTGSYKIDQGDMKVDEDTLRSLFLPPYQAAISGAGPDSSPAQSLMVSFSSWNGVKMSANKYLVTDVLKGELDFTGFVVSDWASIDQIKPGDYYRSVVTAINAGVDMSMEPYDPARFIKAVGDAVSKGDIPIERIDDAVRRILAVKFKLGLFEHPYSDPALLAAVGSEEHRTLAREAVSKSLVMLQNNIPEGASKSALPIPSAASKIFVAGQYADDIGAQCGGWTIQWQGQLGDITPGTTILEAIRASVVDPNTVYYNRFGKFDEVLDTIGDPAIADYGIVVVGESPYAEGVGDSSDLSLPVNQIGIIERLRERSKALVVIIISGRPMIITDQLPLADAWVAAWLPGTEALGITDVLFGSLPFSGKLSFTWPSSMDQLPLNVNNIAESGEQPLFPFGYGLTP
jgi:beta-glucosidase